MEANIKVTQQTPPKKGFSLIEVIAVLVLLGILSAVALPKYISLAETAKERAIEAAISELNRRESLLWSKFQIQSGPFFTGTADLPSSDEAIRAAVLTPPVGRPSGSGILGDGYTFSGSGNSQTVSFQGKSVALMRTPATSDAPGSWAPN